VTLKQPGFQPFLLTQFLGAFNDNLFKIVVSMLAVHRVRAVILRGPGETSIVSAVSYPAHSRVALRLRGTTGRHLLQAIPVLVVS
jgi:hypothetical protein